MPLQKSTLLLTKLHRPPVTGDRIERPRLIEILNHGLAGPLSLVTGPAGFGKSTLVSSLGRVAGQEPAASATLGLAVAG